jgi:hypothetical protein
MLAIYGITIYNMRMSSERFEYGGEFSDDRESHYDMYWCDDPGMQNILEDMLDTERDIIAAQTPYEERELYEDFLERYDDEVAGCGEIPAVLHGKVRPYVSFDENPETGLRSLQALQKSGKFLQYDDLGPYQLVAGEEVVLLDPTLFSTYSTQSQCEITCQVGFWARYKEGSQAEAFYLRPDDIKDLELGLSTRSGADSVVEQYPSVQKDLELGSAEAARGNQCSDWLRQLTISIPHLDRNKKRLLHSASERFIENLANFDEEPYKLEVEHCIIAVDHEGKKRYLQTSSYEEFYVYVHGVELHEEIEEQQQIWKPSLRVSLLARDLPDQIAFLVPCADNVVSLQSTVQRDSLLLSQLESDTFDESTAEVDDDEIGEIRRKIAAINAAKEDEWERDLEHKQQMYELTNSTWLQLPVGDRMYAAEDVSYRDLLAVSDELFEAFNVPSLAWEDPVATDQAAYEYRRQREAYCQTSELSKEDGNKVLDLEGEYSSNLVRHQAMRREILFALFESRQNHSRGDDGLEVLREDLYARFAVDYEEPLGTEWFDVIDALLPGEMIDDSHEALSIRRKVVREQEMEQRLHEAHVRNALSQEFLAGKAIDEKDPTYQIYLQALDDLQLYPYQTSVERFETIEAVEKRLGLSMNVIQRLAAIAERLSRS